MSQKRRNEIKRQREIREREEKNKNVTEKEK